MDNEKNVHDELKELAPGFPDKPSFDATEGYFEKLPDLVINQWKKEQSHPKTKSIFRWSIGMAALICGLLIGGVFLLRPRPSTLAPITSAEAYLYIEENIDEFSQLLEEEPVISETKDLNIPVEEIDEYLLEEMETNPEDLF